MITRLFTRKLRMELEEVKHKHNLELREMQAQMEIEKRHWQEDRSRELAQLKKEHELKITEATTLLRLESQQKTKQAELDYQSKLNDAVKRLNDANYDAMTRAMTKLHEEGDKNTRFTQDLALKMIGSMPANKSETKVLTGSIELGGHSKK